VACPWHRALVPLVEEAGWSRAGVVGYDEKISYSLPRFESLLTLHVESCYTDYTIPAPIELGALNFLYYTLKL